MSSNLDVIVPSFNEYSKAPTVFYSQLEYLSSLAKNADIILVDDGSNDGSQKKTVEFLERKNSGLKFLCNEKNEKKVGAIRLGLKNSMKDFLFLLDFDSRVNLNKIPFYCKSLEEREDVGAIGFRLLPVGNSLLYDFQDVEYAIDAVRKERFFKQFGRIGFASGAGALWKRRVLEQIIGEHSGKYDGEDAELGTLAYKYGYKTLYATDVSVETRVPENFRKLIEQRKRWYSGTTLSKSEIFKIYVNPISFVLNLLDLFEKPEYLRKTRNLFLSVLYPAYKMPLMCSVYATQK